MSTSDSEQDLIANIARRLALSKHSKEMRDIRTLLKQGREQYAHYQVAQSLVNVNARFKNAMAMQQLSARPPKGARFRTPEEELALIIYQAMGETEPQLFQSPNHTGESK